MKTHVTLILLCALWLNVVAQAPQKMSYQAAVRDAGDNLVTNHAVGMKVSILQGSPTGTMIFQELYNPNPQTNSNGLVSIEIGTGIPLTGTFSGIDWSAGPFYLKTETDPSGGTNYTITGTSQLLSVPYALYANTAANGSLWSQSGSDIYFNKGNVGIGTTNPSKLLHVFAPALIQKSQIGNIIELNQEGIGNRHTFIDFHSDDVYTDYGLRIIRFNTGPDANSEILHRGQGGLKLITQDAAPIHFSTSNTNRMTISSDGNVEMANQNIKNLANPVDNQDAATKDYVEKLMKDIGLIPNNYSGTMTDNEGNVYKTVQIGSQVWMAENLKTTKYKDGTSIPLVTDNTVWTNLTTPGYCWYNNNKATYGNIYGALYNWYTVNTGKLCPTGWHVPSDAEWTTLTTYLGGISVAGGKMKEAGTAHWQSPNTGATNESGFSGLPGDCRYAEGTFDLIGYGGYWWSSAESSATGALDRYLGCYNTSVGRSNLSKKYGFSIRCVRD